MGPKDIKPKELHRFLLLLHTTETLGKSRILITPRCLMLRDPSDRRSTPFSILYPTDMLPYSYLLDCRTPTFQADKLRVTWVMLVF